MLNLIFVDNSLIVEKDTDENSKLPELNSIKNLQSSIEIIQNDSDVFVGFIDKINFDKTAKKYHTLNIRQALCYFDNNISQKIVYYLQLKNYYTAHKFCGICGAPLVRQSHSKFVICSECKHEAYPKLAPCVIVRITRGNEILLARSPQFPQNVWALIAGFVELGETLEETIHREVMEEVGIEVNHIQYWGSQSWPIPTSSLMIGFTAEYKSGEITIDNHEIEQAGFFTKENIPGQLPTHFSIASLMIEEFLKN